MKNLYFPLFSLMFVLFIAVPSWAQGDKTLRPSPPAEVSAMIDSAKVIINYSSPSVKGREVWGGLVPYNQVWRTGANEATVFETDKNLMINNQKLPAGKYGFFSIPGKNEWTFIFNTVWDQWGAFKYDSSKDVLRITTPSEHSPVFNERMIFDTKGHSVILAWENLMIKFDVKG